MATKKQKRLAGEERARVLAEESRLSGLRAQKEDHDRKARKTAELAKKKAEQEAKEKSKQNAQAISGIARELHSQDETPLEQNISA